jgi:hypothetical protein
MAQEFPNVVHAKASVNADAEAHGFILNNGFEGGITRHGAGDYTLFLSQPADPAERTTFACGRGNGDATEAFACEQVSDTAIRIRNATVNNDVPLDIDFDVLVMRGAAGISP